MLVLQDPGAIAVDNVDGDLTTSITTMPVALNTTVQGVFTIQYSVKDSASNTAKMSRPVTVAFSTVRPPT